MFSFIPIDIFWSQHHLVFNVFNSCTSIIESLLGFIEMLFHVSTSCNCLDGQSLLAFKLILQIVTLVHQFVVLLHSACHLLNCLVFLSFTIESKHRFSSEHAWQKCGVLSNALQFIMDLVLELLCVLNFGKILVFKMTDFFILLFVWCLLAGNIILQSWNFLEVNLSLSVPHLYILLQFVDGSLLIELVFVSIVFIFAEELFQNFLVFGFKFGQLLIQFLHLVSQSNLSGVSFSKCLQFLRGHHEVFLN